MFDSVDFRLRCDPVDQALGQQVEHDAAAAPLHLSLQPEPPSKPEKEGSAPSSSAARREHERRR